jgi:Fe-S cluster biogenesis protein NfuA
MEFPSTIGVTPEMSESETTTTTAENEDTASEVDLNVLNATLEYIRPALQADGGGLILLGVNEGRVTIQLVGACGGCPLSTMTLTAGIERILRDRVPGVTEVIAV